MKKSLLFILLLSMPVCVNAQTTQTYNIDWSFSSNPSASGDANADRTVEVGDTVIWNWYANGSHNVVSNSDATESFSSPLQGPGSTFSYTFTQVGTNGYVCTPHSGNMFGTITVVPEGTLTTEIFIALEDIKLYPNPTEDQFNLSFGALNNRNIKVELYNTLGKKVKKFERSAGLDNTFDVSELNQGLYLIKISQGKSTIAKRLLIR